jgi:hypothetical protein
VKDHNITDSRPCSCFASSLVTPFEDSTYTFASFKDYSSSSSSFEDSFIIIIDSFAIVSIIN